MSPPTFFQFLFSATFLISIILCNTNPSHVCIPTESKALLDFKNNLTDLSNRLASWDAEQDCCSWFGVVCSNITGRVIERHLRSSALSQEDYYNTNPTSTTSYDEYWERSTLGRNISESLLKLEHLQHLDLSNNNFGYYIPEFLGSMLSLRYLNLSKNDFVGSIPRQLGNLSNLEYLIIQPLFEYNPFLLTVENFSWVSQLSSLKFLELRYVGLGKAVDWLESLSKLPLLEQLHLSSCELEISSFSNVSFPSLSVLDLSFNSFYGVQVPGWISNLTSLVDLDLSNNGFSGNIPIALQSLNLLRRLDLSYNQFNSSIPNWSGGFDRLELLDLSINNELEGKIPDSIGNLTSLSVLDLSFNLLVGGIPKSFENLCRLRLLSLSNTGMSQEINEVIEILSGCASVKLELLDLSNSYFSGHLTDLLGKFKNLVSLVLPDNFIVGPIPVSIGEMTSLKNLDLSFNEMNGTIPLSFGGLEKLNSVSLSFNSLEGEISEPHFQNLTSLRRFDALGNRLILTIYPDWIPPFQLLESLYLRSWNVGRSFPSWIRHLKHLKYLDLSNSKISSTIPTWFYNFSSSLYHFNLSHNQMYGMLQNLSNDDSDYSFIDLSWNHFEGPLPFMSSSPGGIDLSYNLFSGSIHNFLCNSKHKEDANFNTEIINLKDNFLEGEIPDCWLNWTSVRVVELSNNRFSGKIPESLGSLGSLEMLNLRNNDLIGNLSQQGWFRLSVLDLGENKLMGEFPSWIGKDLEWLSILIIRGNNFFGHIPQEVCNLVYLQILDVSNNNLNGTIPTCVDHLFGMFEKTLYLKSTFSWQYGPEMEYTGSTSIVRKGVLVEYSTILNFVQSLDLSNNNFVGEIPEGITNLSGLQSLNLSHNFFTGKIPENISAMRKLESLDLSQNQLFGEIPQSMSTMNFLNNLNLSYNNFSGQIPSSTQLQSFSNSSFIGNNLCGPPLVKACQSNGAIPPRYHSSESGRVDWFHFYVSLGVGFVVGFWCVTSPLVFNRKWRIAYFNFLQLLWDKIWVWFHLHNIRVRNHGS